MANYRAHYTSDEKKIFADRLRRIMLERGIKQAELARQASKYLKTAIGRQMVSSYLSAISVPEEQNMRAIERALDVPNGTLLPRLHRQAPGEGAPAGTSITNHVNVNIVEGGKMHLMLNIEVAQPIGWKIMELLKGDGF